MQGSWPLGENDLAMLNSILDTESILVPFLEKCKECDMPVLNELDTIKTQADWARKVKAKFFPDQP
jgi:hypothetical protein